MTLTRSIAHQTIIQIVAKAFSVILGIMTLGIVTRYLGQEGYGQYTTVLSFVVIFVIMADMGLYSVAITELGRRDTNDIELFSNIITIRIFAAIIAMGTAAVAVLFFPYPPMVKYGVAIAAITTFANLLDQLHVAILQKNLRAHYAAVGEIIEKIIVFVGFYFAVRAGATMLDLLWINVAGFIVHGAITMIAARRLLPYTLKFDFIMWKSIFARAWPIAVSGICIMMYFKLDTILISLLRPAKIAQQEVGIYGAAYKILEVLIVFPSLFLGLMIPHLSYAFSVGDSVRFGRIMQKSFDFFALIALPIIGTFLIKAEQIIIFVAGSAFVSSAPIVRILILGVGVNYLTHYAVYATAAIRQQRKMTVHYVIATIGALITYALTIPRYSYFGAAWTTFAVEWYIGIMALVVVWRTISFRLTLNVFWKATIASIYMAMFMWIVDVHLFLSLFIGGLVYCAIIWFIKGITKEQIKEIIHLRTQPSSSTTTL